jgi:hypothetical protein
MGESSATGDHRISECPDPSSHEEDGTTATAGRTFRDDRRCPIAWLGSFSDLPRKPPHGVTTKCKAHWLISDPKFPAARAETSSRRTTSNRHPDARTRPPGRLFSKLTGLRRSHRLHHRRSMEQKWPHHSLHSGRHAPQNSPSRKRRSYREPG